MAIDVIGLDADDTLWHSEDGFHTVTGRFCELVGAYVPSGYAEPDLAGTLDAVERRNLSLFGYGVKSFTLSMVEAAIEVSGGTVPASVIQQLVDEGRRLLDRPVELLDGVDETLALLASEYRMVVITKGDLHNQQRKFHDSGLDRHVVGLEVVSEKDAATYQLVLARHAIAPSGFVMVGNSVRSDVLPVLELGGQAVHIPYHVLWGHEAAEHNGDVPTLDSIRELPAWVAGEAERDRRTSTVGPAPGATATRAVRGASAIPVRP
jgi:putative hydrolase of the HAD superfamily